MFNSPPCFVCGKPHGYTSRAEELHHGRVVDIFWCCGVICSKQVVRESPERAFRIDGHHQVIDPEWHPTAECEEQVVVTDIKPKGGFDFDVVT